MLVLETVTAIIRDTLFYNNRMETNNYVVGGAIAHAVTRNTSAYLDIDGCQFIENE